MQKRSVYTSWTEAQSSRAVHMYWLGYTYVAIGQELDRSTGSVCSHLESLQWGADPRRGKVRKIGVQPKRGPIITPQQALERDARMYAPERTCGDPPVGYSALERRA